MLVTRKKTLRVLHIGKSAPFLSRSLFRRTQFCREHKCNVHEPENQLNNLLAVVLFSLFFLVKPFVKHWRFCSTKDSVHKPRQRHNNVLFQYSRLIDVAGKTRRDDYVSFCFIKFGKPNKKSPKAHRKGKVLLDGAHQASLGVSSVFVFFIVISCSTFVFCQMKISVERKVTLCCCLSSFFTQQLKSDSVREGKSDKAYLSSALFAGVM